MPNLPAIDKIILPWNHPHNISSLDSSSLSSSMIHSMPCWSIWYPPFPIFFIKSSHHLLAWLFHLTDNPYMPTTFNWAFLTTTHQNCTSWYLIQQLPLNSPITHLNISFHPCSWYILVSMSYGLSGALSTPLFLSEPPLRGISFTRNLYILTLTKFVPLSSSSYFFHYQFIFSVRE